MFLKKGSPGFSQDQSKTLIEAIAHKKQEVDNLRLSSEKLELNLRRIRAESEALKAQQSQDVSRLEEGVKAMEARVMPDLYAKISAAEAGARKGDHSR